MSLVISYAITMSCETEYAKSVATVKFLTPKPIVNDVALVVEYLSPI